MAECRRARIAEEPGDLGDSEALIFKEAAGSLQPELPAVRAHALARLELEHLAEPGATYIQLFCNVIDGRRRGARFNRFRYELPRPLPERSRIFVLDGCPLRSELRYQQGDSREKPEF